MMRYIAPPFYHPRNMFDKKTTKVTLIWPVVFYEMCLFLRPIHTYDGSDTHVTGWLRAISTLPLQSSRLLYLASIPRHRSFFYYYGHRLDSHFASGCTVRPASCYPLRRWRTLRLRNSWYGCWTCLGLARCQTRQYLCRCGHASCINNMISPITFQTFLFSLTLYKFLQAIKDGWRNIPIVVLLMRDGTWAFFILLFLYVGEIGLYALANTAFTGILFGWLLSISSFCGYRILLNLKSFAETQMALSDNRLAFSLVLKMCSPIWIRINRNCSSPSE
ncbi:hypothetical protein BDZ97DRAFT_650808 [Flammula alnicola]|nr:hypothetical protein BDZ97DRAFT_650808 [Flammula alnicola]